MPRTLVKGLALIAVIATLVIAYRRWDGGSSEEAIDVSTEEPLTEAESE